MLGAPRDLDVLDGGAGAGGGCLGMGRIRDDGVLVHIQIMNLWSIWEIAVGNK